MTIERKVPFTVLCITELRTNAWRANIEAVRGRIGVATAVCALTGCAFIDGVSGFSESNAVQCGQWCNRPVAFTVPFGDAPSDIAAQDLDGDGRVELIATFEGTDPVHSFTSFAETD